SGARCDRRSFPARRSSDLEGPAVRWGLPGFVAATVVVVAVALIGIVATLIFQARETKIAREEARRIAIAELLKMAMDDPDLDERSEEHTSELQSRDKLVCR